MERQHAALFREFAELDYRDPAAILAFASTYGELGLPHPHQKVAIRNVSARLIRWHSTSGESHLAWAIEIRRMREALHLSEHLQSFEDFRRLKWLCDRNLRHVSGKLTFDSARRPRLTIEPVGLISAMWLQLARAFTEGKRFVECKFCGRTLEISTDGYRSHREFCSDSCKTKDYRRRKRTARKLAATGLSTGAVATRIDTDPSTVSKWLDASAARKARRT